MTPGYRWLDDESLALFAYDHIGARQLELARNPHGLIPSAPEELDRPLGGPLRM